jgi:ABC-type dipeptide/oligopeptide/nickel transport system permease subunit
MPGFAIVIVSLGFCLLGDGCATRSTRAGGEAMSEPP